MIFSRASWAARFALAQSSWTFGRSSAFSAACGASCCQGPGGGGGERRQFRRQGLLKFFFDVDVGGQLIGEVDRQLPLFGAGAHPVVGVERLAVDPDGEDGDRAHHRGEDQQGGDYTRMARLRTWGCVPGLRV